jgi:hypothetical protein
MRQIWIRERSEGAVTSPFWGDLPQNHHRIVELSKERGPKNLVNSRFFKLLFRLVVTCTTHLGDPTGSTCAYARPFPGAGRPATRACASFRPEVGASIVLRLRLLAAPNGLCLMYPGVVACHRRGASVTRGHHFEHQGVEVLLLRSGVRGPGHQFPLMGHHTS